MDSENRRILTSVHIAPTGIEWLNALAAEMHVPRAAVIRAGLAVARTHEAAVKAKLRDL